MANKVNSLVLGWIPGSEAITDPITVNFTPKYIDTVTGGEVGSGIANGIELVPIASGGGLDSLKSNAAAMDTIKLLANKIEKAKTELNTDIVTGPFGLRGKTTDTGGLVTYTGGKKSKSKKHVKSKKQKKRKSVRRI